jgi:hypothetical protein
MKVIKSFQGVREGDVYPTTIEEGEDCPPELFEAAQALGAVEGAGKVKPPAQTEAQKAEEAARLKAEADAAAKAPAETAAVDGAPENKAS